MRSVPEAAIYKYDEPASSYSRKARRYLPAALSKVWCADVAHEVVSF
jgi:hypothetical protein